MKVLPYVEAFNWIAKKIDTFTDWLKRKRKRDAIQGMENDVANNDADGVAHRLQDIKDRAKQREDEL